MTNIKKYFIIIFIILLIIFFIYYKFFDKYINNTNDTNNINDTNIEGFTKFNEAQFKSEPRQINNNNNYIYPDNLFQPIVLTNTKEFPLINLACLSNNTLSYELAKYFQKYIYPITLKSYNNINILINDFNNYNKHKIDLCFMREHLLISKNNYNNNYNNNNNNNYNNNIEIICGLYYEYLICLATKESLELFSNEGKYKYLNELKNNDKTSIIGVLVHDYIYLKKILDYLEFDKPENNNTKQNNINNINNKKAINNNNQNINYKEEKRNNLYIRIYNNMDDLYIDYDLKNINLIIGLWHPKNNYIQTICRTNQNYLISILPKSKLPLSSNTNFYNTYEEESTNKILEFIQLFKNDFKWSYKHILNVFMLPNIINFNISGYKTFKIKNLLCINNNFYSYSNTKKSQKYLQNRNNIIQNITKNIINKHLSNNNLKNNNYNITNNNYNPSNNNIKNDINNINNINKNNINYNNFINYLNKWNNNDDNIEIIKTNNKFIQSNDEDNFKFNELLTFSNKLNIDNNSKYIFNNTTKLLKINKETYCKTL